MTFSHTAALDTCFNEKLTYMQQPAWIRHIFSQMLSRLNKGKGIKCSKRYLDYFESQGIVQTYRNINNKFFGTLMPGLLTQHKLPWIKGSLGTNS